MSNKDNSSKTAWIQNLAKDNKLWALDDLLNSSWPAPIVYDYAKLNELMSNGNVYGTMLQIKDLYELTMKIPVIMAIVFMDHTNKEGLWQDDNIIIDLIENPLSMGAWYVLASSITEYSDHYYLPSKLVEIIEKTRKLYDKRIAEGVPNVAYWRNENIGHGALKFEDSKAYQREVRGLLKNYKKYILDCGISASLYDDFFFSQNAHLLVGMTEPLSSPDEQVYLSIQGKKMSMGRFTCNGSFFFDSFYLKKKKVKYIDYYSGESQTVSDIAFAASIAMALAMISESDKAFLSSFIKKADDQMLGLISRPRKSSFNGTRNGEIVFFRIR